MRINILVALKNMDYADDAFTNTKGIKKSRKKWKEKLE